MAGPDWDVHYKSAMPPWETGTPSAELARVIAEQKIGRGRVLDVGCGSGINAVWLAQRGFDVTGFDFNALAIERARERAAKANVKARFVQADVLDLPPKGGDAMWRDFPFFFDRGCFHSVRPEGAAAYVQSLLRVTAPDAIGLILTGNAKEARPPGQGPPVMSEAELRAELEPAFEFVSLREFRFDALQGRQGPLAWSCLLRRRKGA